MFSMLTSDFVNSPMGQAAMDYAEKTYSETFNGGEFTLASEPSMLDELIAYHMAPVYEASQPVSHDDESDEIYVEPVELFPGMSLEEATEMAQKSTYVWLCNYKGECDSDPFILKELARGLRTYHGKWNYSD